MNFTKIFVITLCLISCAPKTTVITLKTSPASCPNATIGASLSGAQITSTTNVIPLFIADPATTGQVGYVNEPLVSVTVCLPNHGANASVCQTISNILIDTGSYGLRVFSSAIASNVALTQQTMTFAGKTVNLAQCAQFGSGATWGAIQNGDVVLGNKTSVNIPIQVINNSFASMPSGCSALSPMTDPCGAGFNGIMGVGVFAQDCGADCNSSNITINPGIYLACDSSQCFNEDQSGNALAVPLAQQVVNPIAGMAAGFNNGISFTLPAITSGSGGAAQVSGSFTLGIGVAASNVPGGSVVAYPADPNGATDGQGSDFLTTFSGTTYGTPSSQSITFLDSGSNALYFLTNAVTGITVCPGGGFYCPSSPQNLTATIGGYATSGTDSPTVSVAFSVGNADTLPGNFSAFNNFAGPLGFDNGHGFDWGLPFFFGRTVYVGIKGTTAVIQSSTAGPFWAF